MTDLSHYSGRVIDRASEKRQDRAWIEDRLAAPDARIIPVWRGRNLLRGRTAAFLAGDDARQALEQSPGEPIFLGIDEIGALFALDLSHLPESDAAGHVPGAVFLELYGIATQLVRRDASLLSHAAWLVHWTHRHRFCGTCGEVTVARDAGHVRACANAECGVLYFPRTDPAVIVVTEYRDRCLLARQKGWPDRLHSCLAGFVEPGESAEEALVREVREESGLAIRDVRFHATQPWPYPCSLMLGFFARADSDDIRLDDEELAEARWFSREELKSPDLDVDLPRSDSIARSLIDEWVASG